MTGVLCPHCHSPTHVLETRTPPDGVAVRRRRECTRCGQRFTTFERREPEPSYVIKRDGERQRFDRAKLRAALQGAAHKRSVSASDIEAIVDRVELAAEDEGGEVSSERIGELCLDGLEDLDRGAYLQFAGTLPSIPSGAETSEPAPARAGSVRAAREDPGSTPKAASKGGLDE